MPAATKTQSCKYQSRNSLASPGSCLSPAYLHNASSSLTVRRQIWNKIWLESRSHSRSRRSYLALSARSLDSPGYHPAPTSGESPRPGQDSVREWQDWLPYTDLVVIISQAQNSPHEPWEEVTQPFRRWGISRLEIIVFLDGILLEWADLFSLVSDIQQMLRTMAIPTSAAVLL